MKITIVFEREIEAAVRKNAGLIVEELLVGPSEEDDV